MDLLNMLKKLQTIETGQVSEDSQSIVKATSANQDIENVLRGLAAIQEGKSKPDYIDLDKDGDTEESMKSAAEQAEEIEESSHGQDAMELNPDFDKVGKKPSFADKLKAGAKRVADFVAPDDDELLSRLEKETGGRRPAKESLEECGMMSTPVSVADLQGAEPERFTLTIQRGDKSINVSTDNPEELLTIMKLAGVSPDSSQISQEMPADEVEEAWGNTPAQTNEREPRLMGDITDWSMKGTANAKTHYTPSGQGDNPLGEASLFREFLEYKKNK